MGKRFSVIIPTLWMPDFFISTLERLDNHQLVGEVLVISNKPSPKLPKFSKVKILQQEHNVGVNPAWNLGVEFSKQDNILLLNDDLLFDFGILKKVRNILEDSFVGVVGLDPRSLESTISLSEMPNRIDGFGCFMAMRKENYDSIPKGLRIYFGDDWLLRSSKQKGLINYVISGVKTNGVLSETSKYFTSSFFFEKALYEEILREDL